MRLFHLQLASFRLAALPLCALVLAGCQGVTGLEPAAQVRVIGASPDAPALDIVQTSPSAPVPAGLYNIAFGTVTSYVPFTAGTYTHSAYVAGSQQQLAQARTSFAPGGQYTLLAGNIAASLQISLLKDQATSAPAGQTALRFLGQATRSGAVDLYLVPPGLSPVSIAPIATGVHFGSNTGYLAAPAGTYSILAFPAGVAPSSAAPAYTGAQIAYPATSVRTIVLLDQRPGQRTEDPSVPAPARALQIITAADFDPATS